MDRDRLIIGLAAVFAGLTMLLVVAGLAEQLFLLFVAIPFGATTYFLWYHASGRLEDRTRARAAGGPRSTGAGPRFGSADPRSRFAGGFGADGGRRESFDGSFESGPTRTEAYRTLDLEPGASDEAVREAYRSKVKTVHPDTETGDEERFREVNRAYERLSDD